MFLNKRVLRFLLGISMVAVYTLVSGSESFEMNHSPQNLIFELEGNVDAAHARIYPYNYPVMQPQKRLKIINHGVEPVENIRLVINNSKNWYDFDSWHREITQEGDTDLEKALAIFWFFSYHSVHNCSVVPSLDPVLFINYSSFGCCPQMSAVLRYVFSSLEMPYRNSYAFGHSVNEYMIDGMMRHLDTDIKVFYLDRDNLEPIGINEARSDPYLIKRVPHYFVYDPDLSFDPKVTHWHSSQKMASLYSRNHVKKEPVIDKLSLMESINITLRKGESLEYLYDIAGRIKYFELKAPDYKETFQKILMNGLWETRLDFSDKNGYDYVELENLRNRGNNSDTGLTFIDPKTPAGISLSMKPAYPILGMDILLEAKGLQNIGLKLYSVENPKVQKNISIIPGKWQNLDSSCSVFYPSQNYRLLFAFNPGSQMGNAVEKIIIRTYVQIARISAPELKLGENEIVYSDTSPERNIEIQLQCEPITEYRPPQPPEKCFYPENGKTVHDSKITFKWKPALDESGSEIKYYHFQLSDRRDMRFPLSPNFERPL
ncbi:hypothetical protein JW926_14340, partial [Candidatus Sumerlaeota bacterium]|nr:hypothetical protein [Candidatus Sumerlaeota bacterium]